MPHQMKASRGHISTAHSSKKKDQTTIAFIIITHKTHKHQLVAVLSEDKEALELTA